MLTSFEFIGRVCRLFSSILIEVITLILPETIMLRLIFFHDFFYRFEILSSKQNSGDIHDKLSLLSWKQVSCFLAPGDRVLTRNVSVRCESF